MQNKNNYKISIHEKYIQTFYGIGTYLRNVVM
jgi:hypothetical protein